MQMAFIDSMDLHNGRHLYRYCPKGPMRHTVYGAPLSGTIPMGRLDRRKLQNIPLRKHPALKVLNLILEDVMLEIAESVRLSELRKARAIAIETRERDVARHRFQRDGMITVTNAVTGNMYRLFLDNPVEAPNSFVSTRQLYAVLRLTIPELPRSASLCLWYETGSGKSLRQFRIDASVSTKVENLAGRPLFVLIQ